jgi:hypothetical protein
MITRLRARRAPARCGLAIGALAVALAACGTETRRPDRADSLVPSTAMPGAAPGADAGTRQRSQDTVQDSSRRRPPANETRPDA